MSKRWYNFFVVTDDASPPLEPAPPSQPAPKASAKRVMDVVSEAASKTTFATPVENPASFDELYQSAQISVPPHGYTILKVAEMLQSEHIRALSADVKRKSLMVALDAAGVKVRDIVEDAVARDHALDTYEKVLQKHVDDLRSQKERENQRIEEEINQKLLELRARKDKNNEEVRREQESLMSWRTQKRQEEERIADAVGYFVTENPVTASSSPNKKGGSENVR